MSFVYLKPLYTAGNTNSQVCIAVILGSVVGGGTVVLIIVFLILVVLRVVIASRRKNKTIEELSGENNTI